MLTLVIVDAEGHAIDFASLHDMIDVLDEPEVLVEWVRSLQVEHEAGLPRSLRAAGLIAGGDQGQVVTATDETEQGPDPFQRVSVLIRWAPDDAGTDDGVGPDVLVSWLMVGFRSR